MEGGARAPTIPAPRYEPYPPTAPLIVGALAPPSMQATSKSSMPLPLPLPRPLQLGALPLLPTPPPLPGGTPLLLRDPRLLAASAAASKNGGGIGYGNGFA